MEVGQFRLLGIYLIQYYVGSRGWYVLTKDSVLIEVLAKNGFGSIVYLPYFPSSCSHKEPECRYLTSDREGFFSTIVRDQYHYSFLRSCFMLFDARWPKFEHLPSRDAAVSG